MEVREGIYQVALPLPFPLKIVHGYLLRDGDGWTVVDAGLNYPPGRAAWEAAWSELGVEPGQIRRIILTHAHPDHYGMAGWLAALSGAPVLLSPLEQEFVQHTWLAVGEEQHAISESFSRHGVPGDLLEVVDRDIAIIRTMTEPHPPVLHDLLPGEVLTIGVRQFEVIPAAGHSDGQLALFCRDERLMLCGDAVLMKITPNVGLWPWGDQNPLATFLATLDRLAGLPVDLALPGHGPLIDGFHARIDQLRSHHDERIEQMRQAVGSGADAYQVCRRVFVTETLTSHQLRFAMAETLAHLEYLVALGDLRRELRGERFWYR